MINEISLHEYIEIINIVIKVYYGKLSNKFIDLPSSELESLIELCFNYKDYSILKCIDVINKVLNSDLNNPILIPILNDFNNYLQVIYESLCKIDESYFNEYKS